MPAKLVVKAGALSGLQHAEDNTILAFFKNFAAAFSKGTITIVSHMKATAVVAGVTLPAITVAYNVSGAGFGAVRGTDTFVVPGPEVGTGLSFAIAALAFGFWSLIKTRRPIAKT